MNQRICLCIELSLFVQLQPSDNTNCNHNDCCNRRKSPTRNPVLARRTILSCLCFRKCRRGTILSCLYFSNLRFLSRQGLFPFLALRLLTRR